MRVGLFSAMKDEGPFVLEWVAYNLLRGFGPIVVYSNDSTDGTTELLDALQGQGVLHHVLQELSPQDVPQYVAADTAFNHPAFSEADWLMWLDADEFLYCDNSANNVVELAQTFAPLADGVCVNWLNFGDSARAQWEPGLITQQFLKRGPETASRHVMFKTLFRKSSMIRGFGLHRPFLTGGFRQSGRQIVNTAGVSMHDDIYRSGAFKRHALGNAPMALVAHDAAAIFHYAVKTRDCFEAKRKRGQGTKALNSDDRSGRFREKYWNIYNQNGVTDTRMRDQAATLSAKVDNLLADPATAAAHAHCIDFFSQKLTKARGGLTTD